MRALGVTAEPQSTIEMVLLRARRALAVPAGFSLVLNLLALTVPLYMLQVFDRVLSSRSADTLLFLTLIGLVALGVFGLLDWLRGRILVRIGLWAESVTSAEAFERALEAQIQGRSYRADALRDLARIRGFLTGATPVTLFDAPWVPIYLGVIFMLHPWLGVLGTLGAVVLLGLALANEYGTRGRLREAGILQIAGMDDAEDALRNAEAIDAMGMSDAVIARWRDASSQVAEGQRVAADRGGVFVSSSKFVRLTLQLGTLGLGAYLVLVQQLTPGGMIAGSIILTRALSPVEQAIATWRQLLAAREAYARLRTFFGRERLRPPGIELPEPKGKIEVERVVYVFHGADRPALKGVSFALAPGQSLALIGPSASGKTTLARILVGVLRPSAGTARLDGADVFGWSRRDFGRYVGYLPQHVELFAGSVRENIARLADDPPALAVRAAELAGCHEMILRLPQGYDTRLGAGGGQLSAGQRQRIALARALYGEPKLIVLDEPNSSLDAEGEQALVRTLAQLRERGATVVTIAHRLTLVREVDRILVLRDGAVEQNGPRDEVLARISAPAAAAPPPRAPFPRVLDGGQQA